MQLGVSGRLRQELVEGGEALHPLSDLPGAAHDQFDPLGERLERLEADREWGEGEIDWSIREYASGLYLCRLEARSADGRRADAVVQMAVSR